jgi:hypothetical protein
MESKIRPSRIIEGDATPAEEIRRELNTIKSEIEDIGLRSEVLTITSAQLLTLNATPVTLLPAPGAGRAYIIESVDAHKPAGTAYGGIAAGEDLALKYTNASGAQCAVIETTGFLDQTTAQTRSVNRPVTDITPVANAAIVAHMLVGEITTGNTPLNLRIVYRVIDTVF